MIKTKRNRNKKQKRQQQKRARSVREMSEIRFGVLNVKTLKKKDFNSIALFIIF